MLCEFDNKLTHILEQNKSYINYNSNIKLGKPYLIIINRKSKMKKKYGMKQFLSPFLPKHKKYSIHCNMKQFLHYCKAHLYSHKYYIISKDKWRNIT